jgi:hypothetical protein
MADVAQRYQDDLEEIKEDIRTAHDYFKPNVDRFHKFRDFVFNTSLTQNDKNLLVKLGKPTIEFNIMEAFISRLRGEFSKQVPSIEVSANEDAPVDPSMIKAVEGHVRHAMNDANNNGFENSIWTDLLSGGFSVAKVWTEYASPTGMQAFNQVIKFDRVYDPTLCGFDPLARQPHKGDGRYFFEIYPKTKKEVEEKYNVDLSDLSFTRDVEGFNWSYTTQRNEKILLMCDYYVKKNKRTKIVQLANGKVLPEKQYKEYLEQWNAAGHIQQPAIIVNERWSDIETICRYILIENKVLEYKETDFDYLPGVFIDGNSILLRNGTSNSAVQQMTRPYIYHMEGAQKLKNYAGQTWAAGIENMVMHKWKVCKEGIPQEPEYLKAYLDNQTPRIMLYNHIYDQNPEITLPAPQEVVPVPLPPEVASAFQMVDQLSQTILGSYDASLGVNNNQLSGVAIQEGATQSNAAAMPYVVGFLQGLNQIAQIYVDLMPKYLLKTKSLPVVGIEGDKQSVKVNQPGAINLDYSPSDLKVNVKAGVNFAIQKSRSLQQLEGLGQAFPGLAQFVNEECLDVVLDNIECRGGDIMKARYKPWQQKMKMMQAKNAQMNPMALKAQEIQQKAQRDQNEFITSQQSNANESMKIQLEAAAQHNDQLVQAAKAKAEQINDVTELALHAHDQSHRHTHEKMQLAHDILQSQQQNDLQQQQLQQQAQQPTGATNE